MNFHSLDSHAETQTHPSLSHFALDDLVIQMNLTLCKLVMEDRSLGLGFSSSELFLPKKVRFWLVFLFSSLFISVFLGARIFVVPFRLV